jgi:hypothetical protein
MYSEGLHADVAQALQYGDCGLQVLMQSALDRDRIPHGLDCEAVIIDFC